MNRGLALLLAIAGGLVISFVLTIAIVVGVASILWIFVFGDDSWPNWVRSGIDASIPVLGVLVAATAAWLIWSRLTAPPEAG